jgi:hypothetical protein
MEYLDLSSKLRRFRDELDPNLAIYVDIEMNHRCILRDLVGDVEHFKQYIK